MFDNNYKHLQNEIQQYFKETGLSELWVPKKIVYMKHPPVLGTGKFDYQTAKKMIDK